MTEGCEGSPACACVERMPLFWFLVFLLATLSSVGGFPLISDFSLLGFFLDLHLEFVELCVEESSFF